MAKTQGERIVELLQQTAILSTQLHELNEVSKDIKQAITKIAVLEDRSQGQQDSLKTMQQELHQELNQSRDRLNAIASDVAALREKIESSIEGRKHQSWKFWTVFGPVLGGVLGGLVTVLVAELLR